jgi:peptidoglycan/xylan/chitin deacetylase (PgdA/CDA1 family)
MRRPGVRRLLRAVRRLAGSPGAGKAVILLYHRVSQVDNDPWDLCVSPQNFADHLRVLQELGSCLKVRDLMPALAGGRSRAPVFSVTFDDGYYDNATAAKRILVEHDVPATFFIVSETIGSDQEFWWDALDRVFLTPGELPSTLQLTVGAQVREWELGSAAHYSPEDFRRDASWRADDDVAPGRRQQLFLEVWQFLVSLPTAQRKHLLGTILDWAKLDAVARPNFGIMSLGQLSHLADDELIEIGAHTRSHPSLPDLPLESQLAEISGGKADLENLLGRPVVSFSYPFGRSTEVTERVAREVGFSAACTNICQAVSRKSDQLALPRVQVKDWDGPTFRKVVMSYLWDR